MLFPQSLLKKKMPIPVQQISSLPDIQDYQIIEEALSMQRHNIDIHSIIKENLSIRISLAVTVPKSCAP